jgi:hypothetical protein
VGRSVEWLIKLGGEDAIKEDVLIMLDKKQFFQIDSDGYDTCYIVPVDKEEEFNNWVKDVWLSNWEDTDKPKLPPGITSIGDFKNIVFPTWAWRKDVS